MRSRSQILCLCALILLCSTALLQNRLTTLSGLSNHKESFTYLPEDSRVKSLFLGYHVTYSHYLWIRTVLYFGEHMLTDKNFQWLVQMVDVISRLNPYFYPAYEFAGLIIPDMCNNPAAARTILERGMTHLGHTRWNVSFQLGMIHYKYYADNERAAMYFKHAARVPGAPQAQLGSLAASFFQKSGRGDEGLRLLQFLYASAESPDVKRLLQQKIVQHTLRTAERNTSRIYLDSPLGM